MPRQEAQGRDRRPPCRSSSGLQAATGGAICCASDCPGASPLSFHPLHGMPDQGDRILNVELLLDVLAMRLDGFVAQVQ